MRGLAASETYHLERAEAAQNEIESYPCGCEKCHGFKTQSVEVVERHHRKYGQDVFLQEPLLISDGDGVRPPPYHAVRDNEAMEEDDEYDHVDDHYSYEEVQRNSTVNLQQMA